MSITQTKVDYGHFEYGYDVPDKDNCDQCGKNAWLDGIPAWTCNRELFCSNCWHQDNIADYLNDADSKGDE